jgi:hypothetical protein
MTLGIARRREAPPESPAETHAETQAHAQELDPKPGAEQLIAELAQLATLKEAGVLSEDEYLRQRTHILSELV